MKEGYEGKYGSQSSSFCVPSSPWDLGSVSLQEAQCQMPWEGEGVCMHWWLLLPRQALSPDSACTFFPTVHISRVLIKLSTVQCQVVTALFCVCIGQTLLTNG